MQSNSSPMAHDGPLSNEKNEAKEINTKRQSSVNQHSQNEHHIHKVGVPPQQKLFKEFASIFKETFFADDPLRPFKDQPQSRKLVLGIQAIFPIVEWARSYNLSKFKGDLIAGLTIASLCIPQVDNILKSFYIIEKLNRSSLLFHSVEKQDIGYAKLANLDPQYGLCK